VKQATFVRLFNEHRALTPDLLKALEADTSFRKEEIAELRTSFELADLTRGDFSVVGMLKREADIHQLEQIRALAKKSVTEWVDLVRTTHAAGEITLPINLSDDADAAARVPKLDAAEVYGQMVERQFREAFPTAAFSGGLERAIQTGEIRGLRQPETLSRFLESHDRFELLNTPIDYFLDRRAQPEFASMASDKGFRQELKAVQRVFKVAPNFSATSELLADDLHSAQQIYRVGQSEFVRSYASRPGFTEESARLAWNRAANTHAAVLTVVADLKSLDAEALPQALKSGPAPLSNFPNWNNLFQSGDLCDCEQCRSVLSPAAYFADLLMFLKDRKSAKLPQTVKDILFNRRPDLGYLELNCENALTPSRAAQNQPSKVACREWGRLDELTAPSQLLNVQTLPRLRLALPSERDVRGFALWHWAAVPRSRSPLYSGKRWPCRASRHRYRWREGFCPRQAGRRSIWRPEKL
jgi:hypothetical protein